jgi:hypothetical protein
VEQKFTFFILSIFLLPAKRKNSVDQDKMVYSQFLFTSSRAIALPFDAFHLQALKLFRSYK